VVGVVVLGGQCGRASDAGHHHVHGGGIGDRRRRRGQRGAVVAHRDVDGRGAPEADRGTRQESFATYDHGVATSGRAVIGNEPVDDGARDVGESVGGTGRRAAGGIGDGDVGDAGAVRR